MSDYYATLDRWRELQETIRKLQGEERALREGLFQGSFPDPEEGTNLCELPNGQQLKGVYKINRTPIEDGVKSLPKKLRDKVFKVKHVLNLGVYRSLDHEERLAVDSTLKIKPGLPTLSVLEPKPETTVVEVG
jgi:hypothetical protein